MTQHCLDRRSFCLGAGTLLARIGEVPRFGEEQVNLGVCASLKGVRPFPNTDLWNRDISRDPVDPFSEMFIKSIGLDKPLHADFGTFYESRPIGIPYTVVSGSQPRVPVRFVDYPEQSDNGPYPIPLDAPIEGGPQAPDGSDRHVLVVDRDSQKLYELFGARREKEGWVAGSGAIFDLANNTNRPFEWTSADAAGLPIFPGLVRYDEAVELGSIHHALRFTCQKIRRAYVAPARHWSSRYKDTTLPPMGVRVRLKKTFNTSSFPPVAKAVLEALKVYGMFLADAGSDWYISGTHDPRWDDEAVSTLRRVKGRDLEVVKMGRIVSG